MTRTAPFISTPLQDLKAGTMSECIGGCAPPYIPPSEEEERAAEERQAKERAARKLAERKAHLAKKEKAVNESSR